MMHTARTVTARVIWLMAETLSSLTGGAEGAIVLALVGHHPARDDDLPQAAVDRAWRRATEMVPGTPLGIAMAARARPLQLGLLGHILSSAVNEEKVVALLLEFYPLLQRATGSWSVAREGAGLRLSFAFREPRPAHADHVRDLIYGGLVRQLLQVAPSGPDICVDVGHAPIGPKAQYQDWLGLPVGFCDGAEGVWLPTERLQRPLVSGNPRVSEALEKLGRQVLAERDGSVVAKVLGALNEAAPTFTSADIARRIGLSERSMRRALSAEGSSYRAVVDDHRRELLASLLLQRDRSPAQLADRLGLSVHGLRRAVRRWHGQTLRERMREAEDEQ